jgi:hypothetical protein
MVHTSRLSPDAVFFALREQDLPIQQRGNSSFGYQLRIKDAITYHRIEDIHSLMRQQKESKEDFQYSNR